IEVEQEAAGSGVAVTGVRLRSGPVRRARWYVDASGHRSRLLGRALDLEVRLLGDERVALHRRLAVRPGADVTRLLFSANRDRRMTWAWVLPIGSHRMSVGVVVPAAELRAARAADQSPEQVFDDFIAAFDGVAALVGEKAAGDGPVRSRAFTPFAHDRTSGHNWVLVGDAAALLDPVTSSGVAIGLHSAFAASRLVDHALSGSPAVASDRWAHHHLTVRTTTVINQVVDRVLHRRGLRSLIGTRLAAFVYAITNVLVNAWYTRLRPASGPRIVLHGGLLSAARNLSRLALALDLARRAVDGFSRARSTRSDAEEGSPLPWASAARPTASRSG
ncbi:MAG: tryptophan 7-halogenase, partial [Actinomycetota bacterium]